MQPFERTLSRTVCLWTNLLMHLICSPHQENWGIYGVYCVGVSCEYQMK